MRYQIKVSQQFVRDLDEIELYMIGLGMYEKNVVAFFEDSYEKIEELQEFPYIGRPLSDKTEIPNQLRYLIVDEYLIFYEVINDIINVYRIISQRTDYIRILGL